jgi:hypothetical protein
MVAEQFVAKIHKESIQPGASAQKKTTSCYEHGVAGMGDIGLEQRAIKILPIVTYVN